jgi:hypothetical protein
MDHPVIRTDSCNLDSRPYYFSDKVNESKNYHYSIGCDGSDACNSPGMETLEIEIIV